MHPPPPPQGHFWYPPHSSPAPSAEIHHSFPPPPHIPSVHFPPHPPPQYPNNHHPQMRPPPWMPPPDHLQQYSQPLGLHFPGPPPYPPNPPIYPPNHTPPPYSHPNQMPGNPPWLGTQDWNYSDPNIQYNNGEDWGARAKAWASANSSTEVLPAFGPPNSVYNVQYQHSGMPSFPPDNQNPRTSTPEEYLRGRFTNFHESLHNSTSLDAGDGTTTERSAASSSTVVTMQEVPSSYSFFSGNRETAPGRLPVVSVNPHSRDHSIEFPTNTDQVGVLKQSTPSSSLHGYAQAAVPAPVPLFPHATPVPPVPQFEPPSISSSLPGHSPQVFGRIQQPNFQTHLGFDAGPHTPSAFHVDTVEAFHMAERPKKAAVPNWLKDEIIKKQASIVGSAQEHPDGNSHSAAAQFHERHTQNGDPGKSIDSPRSTEDAEDDEDDSDEERLAAINQEIKRVLTEVLLKVTDELFEEIATKVLNENESEVNHKSGVMKHRDSNSPPPVTPKTSAKVLLTSAPDGANEPGTSTTGGAILGLADYSSSDDDDDDFKSEGIKKTNFPSSDKVPEASGQNETSDFSSEGKNKKEKEGPLVASEELTEVSSVSDGKLISPMEENKLGFTKSSVSVASGNYSAKEDQDLMREKSHVESDPAPGHSNNGKPTTRDDDHVGKETPSLKNTKVHGPTVSKGGSKDHGNAIDDRKSSSKDRRERLRDDDSWKREKIKDERIERFRPAVKDSHEQKKRHTSPPSVRTRVSAREGSFDSASASGDEQTESSRKRRLKSRRESLSPSPTRSRRHVLRSPHSKHSQRRHSPYFHSESRRKRSRSRSSSPGHKRRSGHRR